MHRKDEIQDNSPKRIIFPRRLKSDALKIKGYLSTYHDADQIELTVSASPEDWEKLYHTIDQNPQSFALQFHSEFVYCALEEARKKQLPGKHKYTHRVIEDIKRHSGYLFAFLSYWSKQGRKDWPAYLQKLITMAVQDKYGTIFKDRFNPTELTAYCLSKYYEPMLQSLKNKISPEELVDYAKRQKLSLTNSSDLFKILQRKDLQQWAKKKRTIDPFGESRGTFDNFSRTYIHADRRPQRFAETVINGKTHREIEALAYTILPLRRIFKSLKVID